MSHGRVALRGTAKPCSKNCTLEHGMRMATTCERMIEVGDIAQRPLTLKGSTFCSSPSLRKSVSAPHLLNLEAAGIEVYVVQRPFASFGAAIFKRLPPAVNQLFLDIGVCHYMTVFKTPSGQLVQFDFGPKGGGDISLGPADKSRMARVFRKNRSRIVPAEIREARLVSLPDASLYVGKTTMTMQQIRMFNEAQRLDYEVHKSDCRHYVDRLVQYTTGSEKAAAAAAKYVYELRRQKYKWTSGLTMTTDVQHYPRLKAMSQTSIALAAMLTNREKFSRLLNSQIVRPASNALTRVPATSVFRRGMIPTAGAATAGVAAAAWSNTPVIRNVIYLSEGMRRAASRGISWMGDVARNAGSSMGSANSQVLRLPFRRRQPSLAVCHV